MVTYYFNYFTVVWHHRRSMYPHTSKMRFRESKIFCNTEDSEVPGQVNHYYYIHYTYTYIRLGIYNRVSKSITTQVNDGTRINFEFPEV